MLDYSVVKNQMRLCEIHK